jgi:sigma-B regulation protein RsbU (phosphoserine phosphatase)
MRNPLSVVSLSTHVLARGALDVEQAQAVVRIRTATARADRLIADLLDFTQARLGGGIAVRKRAIQLHALVHDCVHEVAPAYPDRPLTHHRSGAGECAGDPDRLAQLLGNLIGNAMTYGDPGQPVTVTSAIEPESFSVAVHNRGEPISEAVLATLFAPMVRGPGVKTVGRSIGLGLYIVHEIASAHGGTVGVASTADEGTTFVARFPRATG